MARELIISISGLRGIVGENLTPAVAADYACAFGTYLKKSRPTKKSRLEVCLGRDSRTSGQMLSSAVAAGLCSAGLDVVDLGIVPTPSIGVMVRQLGCDGGVVVTASHNSIEYNGIKLLLADGMAVRAEQAAEIKRRFLQKDFTAVGSLDCGKVALNFQTYATHIEKVLGIIDRDTIAAKKFRVVLDSVNGAGGPVGKKLLAQLGCESIVVNEEPSGLFEHPAEPTAENLTALCEIVKGKKADVGFAQDPDADRLAIVDENGTYIGEEYTLALAAMCVLAERRGDVATNLSTSRMVDDIANKAGVKVIRTPVGEVNVATAMVEKQCVIGGEGNGGVIDLRVGPIRDSLVGMALILHLMARTGKTISRLVGEIGGYCMLKEKFAADKSLADRIIAEAKKLWPDATINTCDGCRFDFEDGWLHLRASNTEPVMRVIVETKDPKAARKYMDCISKLRSKVLG